MRPAIVVGHVPAPRAAVLEQLARLVTAVDVDHPTRVAIDGPDWPPGECPAGSAAPLR